MIAGGAPITRRSLVFGAVMLCGVILCGVAPVLAQEAEALTVEQAYDLAAEGQITLLDIRRPDEWLYTGSGEGAYRLDMRRPDFIAALDALLGGDRNRPVAVICARGVRSKRMVHQLKEAGFGRVLDVSEGMLGSDAGIGWIDLGLPLVK